MNAGEAVGWGVVGLGTVAVVGFLLKTASDDAREADAAKAAELEAAKRKTEEARLALERERAAAELARIQQSTAAANAAAVQAAKDAEARAKAALAELARQQAAAAATPAAQPRPSGGGVGGLLGGIVSGLGGIDGIISLGSKLF